MVVDSQHRPWIAATATATLLAGAGYAYYVASAPYGPSGRSTPGLTFGIAGTTLMVLAGLLALRKRVIWRIGSAQLWMKLHIWCSVLAVPLIVFHAGFRLGGALTTTLMAIFAVVIVSGVVGLVLQHIVPAMLTRRLPLETVHSQIDHVSAGLAVDAYEIVAEDALLQKRPGNWKHVHRLSPAAQPAPGASTLRAFYLADVRPYLRRKPGATMPLPDLKPLRLNAPEDWGARVEKLAQLCEESRQLSVQLKLHALLHDWLLIHVPLSFALFALVAIHAFYALRY
jgi:hypothetical protein